MSAAQRIMTELMAQRAGAPQGARDGIRRPSRILITTPSF